VAVTGDALLGMGQQCGRPRPDRSGRTYMPRSRSPSISTHPMTAPSSSPTHTSCSSIPRTIRSGDGDFAHFMARSRPTAASLLDTGDHYYGWHCEDSGECAWRLDPKRQDED
jgi:hypothetical protein